MEEEVNGLGIGGLHSRRIRSHKALAYATWSGLV